MKVEDAMLVRRGRVEADARLDGRRGCRGIGSAPNSRCISFAGVEMYGGGKGESNEGFTGRVERELGQEGTSPSSSGLSTVDA